MMIIGQCGSRLAMKMMPLCSSILSSRVSHASHLVISILTQALMCSVYKSNLYFLYIYLLQ
jgi:hypothetical protein